MKKEELVEMIRKILLHCVDVQMEHETRLMEISDVLEIEMLDSNLFIDIMEPLFDIIGIPKDNAERRDFEEFNRTGEWPRGAYCRDWIYGEWCDCVDGKLTEEEFVDEIIDESKIKDA